MPEPASQPTFESAIERLNSIVHAMESDELPLEALLSVYEEGAKLVKICQTQLAHAQQRLEIIQMNAAKDLETRAFDPASAAKADAPKASAKDASLF